jgi:capsid protein
VFRAEYGPYVGNPGAEISRERSLAAAVTTDLLTSNSVVATLVENLATYAVGNGLTLSSRPDHVALGISPEAARDLSNRIERAWLAWASNPVECDSSGRHDVHQLANATYKSWIVTGEAVVLLDWQRGNSSRTATKVKLLDSRQLDQTIKRADGRTIGLKMLFETNWRAGMQDVSAVIDECLLSPCE